MICFGTSALNPKWSRNSSNMFTATLQPATFTIKAKLITCSAKLNIDTAPMSSQLLVYIKLLENLVVNLKLKP